MRVEVVVAKTAHADQSGDFAIFLDPEGNKMVLNSPNQQKKERTYKTVAVAPPINICYISSTIFTSTSGFKTLILVRSEAIIRSSLK